VQTDVWLDALSWRKTCQQTPRRRRRQRPNGAPDANEERETARGTRLLNAAAHRRHRADHAAPLQSTAPPPTPLMARAPACQSGHLGSRARQPQRWQQTGDAVAGSRASPLPHSDASAADSPTSHVRKQFTPRSLLLHDELPHALAVQVCKHLRKRMVTKYGNMTVRSYFVYTV
jgi:hypothetical protein